MNPERGPGSQPPTGAPVVHSITTASTAHSDDLDARIRRYLISMGIRTVCVVLVLVIHNPIRWAFAVLAVILPYVAVVMANAVGNRRGSGAAPVPPAEVRQISLTDGDRFGASAPNASISSERPS